MFGAAVAVLVILKLLSAFVIESPGSHLNGKISDCRIVGKISFSSIIDVPLFALEPGSKSSCSSG